MKIIFPHIVLLVLLSVLVAVGGEEVQIVLLSAPRKECGSIRAELNQPDKGSAVATMDTVLKRKGVVEVARFAEETPWHPDSFDFSEVKGELGAGVAVRNLEVKLTMQGEKKGEKGEEALTAYIELPASRRSYRSFSSFVHQFELLTGRWQERASWEDGNDSLMLWQFAGSSAKTEVKKSSIPGDAARLEMLWLQASSADLVQTEKAGPASIQKATEWLCGRARVWKGGSIMFKVGDKISWHAADGTLSLEDGEEVANEIGVHIEGTVEGVGEERELSFKAEFGAKDGNKVSEQLIQAKCSLNMWSFLKLDGTKNCNTLVYRVVTE